MKKVILIIIIISTALLAGVLTVISEPTGALITINDRETGQKCPATFNITTDTVSVAVKLGEYHFQPRLLSIGKNDTVDLSFTHLPILDTLTINGNQLFGILYLPNPPVELPYLINEFINEQEGAIVLPAGEHKLHWDGSISYHTIDTTINIIAGEIQSPQLNFTKRFSKIKISTIPDSAEIYLDGDLIGFGKVLKPVVSGTHSIKVAKRGFDTLSRNIILFPGKSFRDTLTLTPSADTDEDGFPDSTDLCPSEFGVYSGCPEIPKGNEIKKLSSFFGKHFWNQPLTFEISAINIQHRIAVNQDFRSIISLYNDGASLFNNYRGVNLLNKIWLGKNLFIGSAEVSQNFMKLQYKKPYKITPFYTDEGGFDTSYVVDYDEFNDVIPSISIFSFTGQLGIRLVAEKIAFAFLFGYQYETIEFSEVTEIDTTTGEYELISDKTDNSNIITTVKVSFSPFDKPMTPTFYGEMSFTPRDNADVTGWMDGRIGISIPWYKPTKKPPTHIDVLPK
jgi:hypothetical protein